MWIESFKKNQGRDLQCVKKSKVYIYNETKNEDDDGDRNRKRSATETKCSRDECFFSSFSFFFLKTSYN